MSKRRLGPLTLLLVPVLVLAACTQPAPPAISATVSPEDGAVDVAVTTLVTATFNVAINESTLSGAFSLSSEAGDVAGVLSYDAALRTATFTPSSPLAYDTEYTAAVAGTLRSAAGVRLPIPLTGAFSWSFTTEAEPDEVDPAVTAVAVTPATASLEVDGTQQLAAVVTAVGGADESVTWSSSDEAVATVSSTGVVTAMAEGSATITATSVFNTAVSGSATVTVTDPTVDPAPEVTAVVVTPAAAAVLVGETVQLDAVVTAVGGASTAVTWSSSDTAVATVDGSGLVLGVSADPVTITATSVFDGTVSGSASVTVSVGAAVVSVSIVDPGEVYVTDVVPLQAIVVQVGGLSEDVSWSSVDETGSATIDSVTGELTAISAGTVAVTATSVADSTVSDVMVLEVLAPTVAEVVVTPASVTLEIGESEELTADVTAFGGASQAVTWRSDDEAVATVDAGGLVTAVAGGTATITATSVATPSVSDSAEVTVNQPEPPVITAFSSEPETVPAGSTIELQWSITGVANQVLITNDRDPTVIDASGATSATVTVPGDRPTITFTLTATNTVTSESDSQDLTIDLELWVCSDDADPITFSDPTLEAIVRGLLGIGPADPITCTGMQTLTSINTGHFDGNPGDIASLEGLQHATNLTHLDAQYNEISDAQPIANLSSLEIINFDRNEILDLQPFSGLTNLVELGLWDNGPVDGEGFDGINDLTPLSGLTNLQTLYLSSNDISDLSPLGSLVNLELLWVMNNRILDLGPVASLVSLRSFRVGWNLGGPETGFARITDISPLAGLPDLAWLGLEWAAIGDTTPLSFLPSLYAISLEGNRLDSVSDLVSNLDFPTIPTEPLPFAPADPTLNVVDNCLDTDLGSAASADIALLEGRGIVVLGFTSAEQQLCPAGGDAIDRFREFSLQEIQRTDSYR